MEFDAEAEQKLKIAVSDYLKKGRTDWDFLHSLACVYWMKELLKHEAGSLKLLITAAYLHDIGYSGKFKAHYSFQDNEAVKHDHMVHGKVLAEKMLRELGNYTENEIKRIAHLVRIHDELDKIRTQEAQLLFEADSLASIDVERVKPTFDKKNYSEFLDVFEKKRVPRFKTKKGKEILKKLLKKAKNYFK